LPGRLWVIRLAETISSRIKRSVNAWPKAEKDRLGDQLVRAVDSIGANISEGYVRIHVKERLHFYSIAQGSLEESLFHIRRAHDRELFTRLEAFTASELLLKLSRALIVFKQRTANGNDQNGG
jgi:four helix bundle protein